MEELALGLCVCLRCRDRVKNGRQQGNKHATRSSCCLGSFWRQQWAALSALRRIMWYSHLSFRTNRLKRDNHTVACHKLVEKFTLLFMTESPFDLFCQGYQQLCAIRTLLAQPFIVEWSDKHAPSISSCLQQPHKRQQLCAFRSSLRQNSTVCHSCRRSL